MFRIKKIFENVETRILKIEGEITDEAVADWSTELNRLIQSSDKDTILELCQVSYISLKAVAELSKQITDSVYLLNSATFISNMLVSSGLSRRILE